MEKKKEEKRLLSKVGRTWVHAGISPSKVLEVVRELDSEALTVF